MTLTISALCCREGRHWTRPVAFTLFELLVVIAVITTLGSLLLPALSQAKQSAFSMKCRSNLRQLAIGLRLYVDDHQVYPPFVGSLPDYTLKSLDAYLRQGVEADRHGRTNPTGVFKCPSSAVQTGATALYGYCAVGLGYSPEIGQGLAGWLEPMTIENRFGTESSQSFRTNLIAEAAVKAPADRIALGDSMTSFKVIERGVRVTNSASRGNLMIEGGGMLLRSLPLVRPVFQVSAAECENSVRERSKRHGGIANVAFCDGRVASLKLQALFFDESDEALSRWNNDHEPHRELVPSGFGQK
ncbi:MAG: hypothetical protein HY735_23335 [Verrucomicrobia bacterium]|nr:hypothetical protein [Verrucomicrobiota bacterium]